MTSHDDPRPTVQIIQAANYPVGGVVPTPSLRVIHLFERIFEAAERLVEAVDADEFSYAAAIIMLSTASETAARTATQAIIERRQLGPLALVATGWVQQWNLSHGRIRDTWNAVATDAIDAEPFWPDFQAHVKRRHALAHDGQIDGRAVTRSEADASLVAVHQLLDHVKAVLARNGL